MSWTPTRKDQLDSSEKKVARGVEANTRLTGSTALLLLLLLAAEGLTILQIHKLLTPHVFIGFMLVPPVLLKVGSTSYRFVKYYSGSPAYREKGPPALPLRILAPLLIVLTAIVLASGIALLFVGNGLRQNVLFIHKVSFILWFGATSLHVLAHLLETARFAPRDWYGRARGDIRGAGLRQWAVASSLALGIPLALLFIGRVGQFIAS